jgi:putative endonuclease
MIPYTYILLCADGTFYIGSTNNLDKRLHQHNGGTGGAKYTRGRRPVKLVWKEEQASLGIARSREAELKRLTRKEKMALIATHLLH